MGDRYNPLYELGSGAFGKAWVVKDNKTEKKCVSKIIQIKGLSSSALDRCVTEVAVLSACSHVNIVKYIEAFVNDGALHIIMEFASGGDLYQKIEGQNGVYFNSDVILEWFLQVVMALEYIHSKNILHRDLKPQNIFLTDSGVVKLGDFGIARVLRGCDDLASTRIGTPFYISPEICQNKQYNSSSDMWAAGCLLYQMCTLRVPFHAANFEELTKVIVRAKYTPIPSHFSPVLSQLVSKLLIATPCSRLSSSQLLNLDCIRGMVLYLKQKYNVRGQKSRTRSSSLVTARSRTQEVTKTRSNSADRVRRGAVKVPENRGVQPNLRVKGKSHHVIDSGNRSPSNVKVKGCHGDNLFTSETKDDERKHSKFKVKNAETHHNVNIANNEREYVPKHGIYNFEKQEGKVKHVSTENKSEALKMNDQEKQTQIAKVLKKDHTCIGVNTAEKIGQQINGVEVNDNSKDRVNSRTYTIKESVARHLSQASPRLSQTVRKQRFSLSVSDQSKLDINGTHDTNDEDADDVFQSTYTDRRRINSETYTVTEKGSSDTNNNDAVKESNHSLNAEFSSTMLQALSVKRVNVKLAEKILLKAIIVKLGRERSAQLIDITHKLIVEDGQSYQCLYQYFRNDEHDLLPLICMYLAM